MIFQGQEEGKAGRFQVLFSPLVGVPALPPHHCSVGVGHPQPCFGYLPNSCLCLVLPCWNGTFERSFTNKIIKSLFLFFSPPPPSLLVPNVHFSLLLLPLNLAKTIYYVIGLMSSNPLSIFPSQHSEQLISSQFTFLPFSVVNLKVSFPNMPLLLAKAHFYLFLNSRRPWMSNRISPGLWNLTVFALCSAGSMHEFTSY